MNKVVRKDNKSLLIALAIVATVLIVCGTILFIYIDSRMRSDIEKIDTDDISEFVDDKIIGSEGKVEKVASKPSLEDIIEISQLQVLSYNYNSICNVIENREVVYYVAYEGTVILGIDFNEIDINVDEDNQSVEIILPEVAIQSCNVDAASLKYIFVDSDYDTGSTGTKAQTKCEDDMMEKIPSEGLMFDLARENTITEIEALTKPIMDQYYSDYTLNVRFE